MNSYLKRSAFDLLKIGIGPSSSHTLGPMNMARKYREELLKIGDGVTQVCVTLKGSLAHTGVGHLTPNALCAGLLGLDPVLSPIEEITGARQRILLEGGFHLAEKWISTEIEALVVLDKEAKDYRHPNTAIFLARDGRGKLVLEREYCSVGGGLFVEIQDLKPTLNKTEGEKISFSWILEECSRSGLSLVEWTYAQEELKSGLDKKGVHERLRALWQIMQETIDAGFRNDGIIPGKLGVRRRARKTLERLEERVNKLTRGMPFMGKAGIYALSVSEENACGGRVVTAPTCGACGVLPGVLTVLSRDEGFSDESVYDGLMIAALIGNIVVDRASISGAEVGCQGEVGVACAMAAAAFCAMNGGSNYQIEEAAEAGLEHHLGLTCDPVMGLVQVPCIERNAVAAGTAINTANLALLGEGSHLISFDCCVDTMMLTGTEMSEKYKETSLGGLATTHC